MVYDFSGDILASPTCIAGSSHYRNAGKPILYLALKLQIMAEEARGELMEDYLPPKEHTSWPGSSPRHPAETSEGDQKQSGELVELSQAQGQWSKQDLLHIAENGETPVSVLAWLAKHEDVDVRIAVADNPNSPLDLLMSLSNDECVDVRYAIAENHNAPHAVLHILVFDENPYVASRAQKTINRVAGGSIVTGKFGTNVYISRSRWQA